MAKSTISRHHFDISSLLNICIVPFSVHDLKLSVGRGRKLPKNKHILFNQTKTFDDFFRPFFTVPKFNFSGRPAQTQSSFNDFKIQNQNAQNCFQTLLIYSVLLHDHNRFSGLLIVTRSNPSVSTTEVIRWTISVECR